VFEDQNKLGEDSGSGLNTIPEKGILTGIKIGREINAKWLIETGVLYKVFYQSIIFNQPINYPYTLYAFGCLQVPFGIAYKVKLTDKI
jgi:hypothetical protein